MASKNKIQFRRHGDALIPASIDDAVLLRDDYAEGALLDAALTHPRSTKRNAHYWAGLTTAVKNFDDDLARKYPKKENLHRALLTYLGHTTTTWQFDGTPRIEADSTAFDNMKTADFERYLESAKAQLTIWLGYDPWAYVSEIAA
ncbi:hypothetical protein [Maritalea porphyrae]|uniref:hypothetical protein n=1 Tax=Maritalea porphyrae TaxID=880732 RepID=UPI0022AF90E0|nr:hypothetical protein [Maritalea porphyrae]MCZ4270933.1 hypothetical protein [Maritalea porphyrae]